MSGNNDYSREFDDVFDEEQRWIERRRVAAGIRENDPTVGLAFSGGGIRSATFNLGVLQALEKADLLRRVDYLSSVSGGGYIATCLAWLRSQTRETSDRCASLFDVPVAEHSDRSALDWLRSHSKFLINEEGFSAWTLAASIFASVILNLLVLLPPLLLLTEVAAMPWERIAWPVWLQFGDGPRVDRGAGFALMLLSGIGSLGVFVVMICVLALVAGVRQWRSTRAILAVRRVMGWAMMLGVGLIVTGTIPLVESIDEALIRGPASAQQSLSDHLTYLMPAATGLLSLWRAGRARHIAASKLASAGMALLVYGLLQFAYHISVHTELLQSAWFYGALIFSVVLATMCDINWVSMHSYYRARISAAYMPPIGEKCAKSDNAFALSFQLNDVVPESGTPLPIINTTLNTTSSPNTKLRSRGGDSFFFTPLRVGSTSTGYRRSDNYMRGKVALSTAATISGAAVDPNTRSTRSRPIAALMALLNFRLGYWAQNPKTEMSGRRLWPRWYLFIAREMLGVGLAETMPQVHLSDGGHFDNLGLYELLRRRCKFIIVSDASADPEETFASMGLAIERARADFGVSVDLTVKSASASKAELAGKSCHTARVKYADGTEAELLYLRPALANELPADIYSYWRENPTFPNQSTADQFFDERQFGAYRELGRLTLSRLIQDRGRVSISELVECARGGLRSGHSRAYQDNAEPAVRAHRTDAVAG